MKKRLIRWTTLATLLGLSSLLKGASAQDVAQLSAFQTNQAHSKHKLSRPALKGRYAYSGEAGCLYAPGGFNPQTLVPNGFSFLSSFSVIGVWTFHGDGTSTLTGRVVSTSPSCVWLLYAERIHAGCRW